MSDRLYRSKRLRVLAPIHGPSQTIGVIAFALGLIGMLYLTTAGKSYILAQANDFYYQAGWTAAYFATAHDFNVFVSESLPLVVVLVSVVIACLGSSYSIKLDRERTENSFLEQSKERRKLN